MKGLRIGSLILDNPFFLAPLEVRLIEIFLQ